MWFSNNFKLETRKSANTFKSKTKRSKKQGEGEFIQKV